MESKKKTTAKNKVLEAAAIISIYMDYVLENNEEPKNVHSFCKKNSIEETIFYNFFGSIDVLKQEIWVRFFENTMIVIDKESANNEFQAKDELLTMYFTLFEILTLNRSYIIFSLKDNKEGIKNLKSLKEFRKLYKKYIMLVLKGKSTEIQEQIAKVTTPILSEGAWLQFLFLLQFWIEDTSKGFEKTDILIEKTVHATLDLLNTKPLESLFDLGKFLWKEKMD
ncbi:TetR family transcriptional regulator C-terminal domain-containing protein [Flavobacterium sp. SUN046]|uniref:TetR family transcriptional regulator C-terminal domain-containing protein n=1 Tax=Flavobacterium sp. SUN046 TaxID=3002440 RepID=UPI002DBA0D4E|nr:TetR family transcriptional regulator C-terminal domain-containing protein [Flavobacterium sp. SUN046]MEC4049811.1 TetR family transcriptional regulator C-terminal domain-containing protein [Flavobacterium sp. SUN046]